MRVMSSFLSSPTTLIKIIYESVFMRTVRVILNNGNKKIKFNYDQNVQNLDI